jgi:hypothetical protein
MRSVAEGHLQGCRAADAYRVTVFLPPPQDEDEDAAAGDFFLWFGAAATALGDDNYSDDDDDDDNNNNYEANLSLGELLGKVEVGLSDDQVARVTRAIEENTAKEACPICLEQDHGVVRVIKCGHRFCNACIVRWLQTHKKCPCCIVDLEDKFLNE